METKTAYLDEYKIIRTLGSGYHAKVKLAESPDHKLVAIKRFKPETANLGTLKHELEIMSKLHHENLVNLIDVRQNSTYKKKTGVTFTCFAIILEYVGGGELFDFIALGGRFSPNVTRTYFHQMMAGLSYMHHQGVAHRDIKPENILLTSDFVLKLADFGFSTLLQGKDGSGILHTKLGTDGYMAPEIQLKNYVGTQVDIFAAGVILFIMYTASPPFERSVPNDPYYKLIKDKNFSTFWGYHSKRRPAGFFTQQFKDLVNGMLAYDPKERLTITQIAQHPWVKGQLLTMDQMRDEFILRKKKVDHEANKQRQEKEKKKAQRSDAVFGKEAFSRSEDSEVMTFVENFENQSGKTRNLPKVESPLHGSILTKENEDFLFSSILTYLHRPIILRDDDYETEFRPTVETQDNKVCVTFTYDYDHVELELEVEISVAKVGADSLSVSFERVRGNPLYYRRLVQLLKDELN